MGNQDGRVDLEKQNCSRKKLWEELPAGPLIEIAKRLNYYEDFEAFYMVCSSWYNALRETKCKFLEGRSGYGWPVPWLLLDERQIVTVSAIDETQTPCKLKGKDKGEGKQEQKQHQHIRVLFYSLSSQRIKESIVRLPSLENDFTKDCYILSSHGWLLVISNNKVLPSMFMFSPFRSPPHNYIPLPVPQFLYPLFCGSIVKKFTLSNPTSKNGCSFDVVILYNGDQLAVWRPGDSLWTRVQRLPVITLDPDITFFRGKFYVIDGHGWIFRFSPDNKKNETIIVHHVTKISMFRNLDRLIPYIVVHPCDKLLWVVRQPTYPANYRFFKVFEIALHPKGEVIPKEVNNLGNASLFVGLNESFSIEIPNDSHCFYGCKPNRIYFTDDFRLQYSWSISNDMWVFNMADGSIEQHFQGQSNSSTSPPLWLQPCSYAN